MRPPARSGSHAGARPGARPARLPVWARLAVGALALLFAPDCTRDLADTASGGEPATDEDTGAGGGGEGGTATSDGGALLTAAVWTLAWDTEGASFPEGGGVEIETDLGYRVHVSTGRILSHSLSFGLCDPAASGSASGSSEQASFSFGLPVRTARAHAENADPSMIETSLVEDLTAPHETELDSSFTAARYCRAHWLVARPLTATKGPADVPMEGRSVFVTGTAERDGRRQKVEIDTWWPDGLLVELTEAAAAEALRDAGADGEPRHAFVKVTRHLGRLFDGIDFETATGDQVTGLVLDNLVGGADIEVELWAPGGAD